LESVSTSPTRALVTDVGNDILYGFSACQTLAWVAEAVERLQRFTKDIVLTDLPLAGIRRLSKRKFLLSRSILFPSCRLSLGEVVLAAEQVNDGLAALAASRSLQFFRLKPEWYGFDPIHIRPSKWRPAWQEILGVSSEARRKSHGRAEGLKLYFTLPEREWLLGREQHTPQVGIKLRRGARVWLY